MALLHGGFSLSPSSPHSRDTSTGTWTRQQFKIQDNMTVFSHSLKPRCVLLDFTNHPMHLKWERKQTRRRCGYVLLIHILWVVFLFVLWAIFFLNNEQNRQTGWVINRRCIFRVSGAGMEEARESMKQELTGSLQTQTERLMQRYWWQVPRPGSMVSLYKHTHLCEVLPQDLA